MFFSRLLMRVTTLWSDKCGKYLQQDWLCTGQLRSRCFSSSIWSPLNWQECCSSVFAQWNLHAFIRETPFRNLALANTHLYASVKITPTYFHILNNVCNNYTIQTNYCFLDYCTNSKKNCHKNLSFSISKAWICYHIHTTTHDYFQPRRNILILEAHVIFPFLCNSASIW